MSPQYSILVVEDDPATRAAVTELLRDEGYAVWHAFDGEEAAALLRDKDVDLVVTDLSMPRLDGMALIDRVRQLHPTTHVMVLTGLPAAQAEQRARSRGAIDYLHKPLDAERLLASVGRALGRTVTA